MVVKREGQPSPAQPTQGFPEWEAVFVSIGSLALSHRFLHFLEQGLDLGLLVHMHCANGQLTL